MCYSYISRKGKTTLYGKRQRRIRDRRTGTKVAAFLFSLLVLG